jgi:hypothetical protein
MRRNNFLFQQGLANFKKLHENIEWGILPWLRENKKQIKIFGYSNKKIPFFYSFNTLSIFPELSHLIQQ